MKLQTSTSVLHLIFETAPVHQLAITSGLTRALARYVSGHVLNDSLPTLL